MHTKAYEVIFVKGKFSAILLLFAAIGLLGGCSRSPETSAARPPFRVVERIEISFQNGPLSFQRSYHSSEKMQKILDYLLLIDPYGTPPVDPEKVGNTEFQILLLYTDGSQKRYRQRGHRYMQVQNGSWKYIDPEKAEQLSEILSQTPSDP